MSSRDRAVARPSPAVLGEVHHHRRCRGPALRVVADVDRRLDHRRSRRTRRLRALAAVGDRGPRGVAITVRVAHRGAHGAALVRRPAESRSPAPKNGQDFGVVHIPRFGADYSVTVAGGVTKARTLDKRRSATTPTPRCRGSRELPRWLATSPPRRAVGTHRRPPAGRRHRRGDEGRAGTPTGSVHPGVA